eukprot:1146333-Pelagomonas_calceolata.AAC.8
MDSHPSAGIRIVIEQTVFENNCTMQALQNKHGLARPTGCRHTQATLPAASRVLHPSRLGLKRGSHIVYSASPPPEQAKQATLPEIKTSGVGSSGKAVVVHRLMVQMILAQPPNLVSGQLHSLPHLDGFSIVALVMSSVLFTKACCKALSRHALYKWMTETGPVYLLPTGPVSSFLHDLRCYTGCDIVDLKEIFFSACITAAAGFARVISDPAAAKHVLRASDNPQSITAYLWHSALWASLVAAKEACWHYLPTLMPKDLINAAAYLWHSAPWASLFAATEACWHYLPTVLPKNFIDAAAS